jgi:hypothetical protein
MGIVLPLPQAMRSGSVGFIVKVKKRASGSGRRLADVRCGAEAQRREREEKTRGQVQVVCLSTGSLSHDLILRMSMPRIAKIVSSQVWLSCSLGCVELLGRCGSAPSLPEWQAPCRTARCVFPV